MLTGLSRLILAVHWPSDVIGGWAFGAGWTLLMARLAIALEGRTAQRLAASVIEPVKESIVSDHAAENAPIGEPTPPGRD